MRPTIDEQLDGAQRLLTLAETADQPAAGELARDARRLIRWVAHSWTTALPFLNDDNGAVARLLGVPEPEPQTDLTVAAAMNSQLRQQLSENLRSGRADFDRSEVLRYLRTRLAADPT